MTTLSTLVATETARQEIKKSRFLAVAGSVGGEAAAKEFIAGHSDPTANHNCWAWRIGQSYRFSDDGEPSGTAGKPILRAIDGQGLDGVAVVVTRWFGGVLLGSGGLIRAYGGTAALCLRAAGKVPLIEKVEGLLVCTFSDLAIVQARLAAMPAVEVLDQTFTATGAELRVAVHRAESVRVCQLVADVTSGRAVTSWEKPT